jgi:hypothetical protein
VTQYSANQIKLDTGLHTPGASYTLHLPTVGLLSNSGKPLVGPFELDYTGVVGSVLIQLTRVIDARTIELIFNRRANEEDASNIANYVIALDELVDPALTVVSANRISDFHYTLTTSRQVYDEPYEVYISNIRGAA